MENYKYKYEKYKTKYLNLKNRMLGGGNIDMARALYVSVGRNAEYPFKVYIPEEELIDNVDIHQLFKKYGIDIHINNMLKLETLRSFSKNNKEKYTNPTDPVIKYTHIAKLSELFEEAKQILKEYLLVDEENYDDKKKWWLSTDEEKRRIFSHHYEKMLVNNNKEKYNKIKFPERILVIKDENNAKLSRNDAIKYIDLHSFLYLDYDGGIYFDVDTEDLKYKLHNYTTYIEEKGRKQLVWGTAPSTRR